MPWTAVADAYRYGERAIQTTGGPLTAADTPKMSEDCLFLNRRATMVFDVDSHVQNDPYDEICRILVKSGT